MAEQKNDFCAWFPIVVILVVLGFIILDPFTRSHIPDKAKNAEVKQNLHAIQLALERYAVDHDGLYPMYIMGGDWTDSYAVTQDWCEFNGLENPEVEFAPPGMGDALILESYMPRFPQNPFKKVNKSKLRLVLEHCNHLGEITSRFVGGDDSRSMVEVFEPQFIHTDQEVSGDFFVHHIFNNPPYDINDMRKENGVDWNNPSGNELLVGNFSYFPRPEYSLDFWLVSTPKGLSGFEDTAPYLLAGYGSVNTPGQDVYNRNGNYKGRFRTEPCWVDCSDSPLYPDDIPCICPGDGDIEPTMYKNNGGSDTLPDGVVITLDGGVNRKTSAVNFSNTEGS